MTADYDTPFASEPAEGGSWAPVDLWSIADGFDSGELVGPRPTLLERDDGVCLIYPGEIHSLSGEPESCKGWIALSLAAELVQTGRRVLYLDFEDSPQAIYARLRALGASRENILEHFDYIRPEQPPDSQELHTLAWDSYTVTVIDGISEAYALLGLNVYDNTDAATFLQQFARPLTVNGAAVIELDHVTKAKDGRGRYALGAQHKLAGIAVAYTTDVIKPLSRQQSGLVKLRVEKDRHGHVRGHAQGRILAEVTIIPSDDGEHVQVTLAAPPAQFRPDILMQRVADYLNENPGAGLREIKYDVRGNTVTLPKALAQLIKEGYVQTRPGGNGRSTEHHLVKPFLR